MPWLNHIPLSLHKGHIVSARITFLTDLLTKRPITHDTNTKIMKLINHLFQHPSFPVPDGNKKCQDDDWNLAFHHYRPPVE